MVDLKSESLFFVISFHTFLTISCHTLLESVLQISLHLNEYRIKPFFVGKFGLSFASIIGEWPICTFHNFFTFHTERVWLAKH